MSCYTISFCVVVIKRIGCGKKAGRVSWRQLMLGKELQPVELTALVFVVHKEMVERKSPEASVIAVINQSSR